VASAPTFMRKLWTTTSLCFAVCRLVRFWTKKDNYFNCLHASHMTFGLIRVAHRHQVCSRPSVRLGRVRALPHATS
jgi:hypothetical protein